MSKPLGIVIPYFMITIQCKDVFVKLMEQLKSQMNNSVILYVYEDGQISDWLIEYKSKNIIIDGDGINKGVSYARNRGIDYLIDKVNYILFLDSDDRISDDYISKYLSKCKSKKYDVLESGFYVKEEKADYNPNVLRNGVVGSAFNVKLIGNNRFDESLQIGEDTKFVRSVLDLNKHKKEYVDTNYYYQYGINDDSLTRRYSKGAIGITR